MARHYRQTRKDRRDESRGMRRYERDRHERRRDRDHHDSDALMMPRDSGEDHGMHEETQMYHMGRAYYGPGYGHPSNLPPYPDIKMYPKERKYLHTDDYPDTLREIDDDDEDNMDNVDRQPSDSMY